MNPHRTGQSGFTLIELLVVLVILALMTTLVIPSLDAKKYSTTPFQQTVSRARREALARAQALRLDVRHDGQWTLTVESDAPLGVLASGTLVDASTPIRLHISPLGVCVRESPSPQQWDALACDTGALTFAPRVSPP